MTEDMEEVEVHHREFRGCHCPRKLFVLVDAGTVSIKEAWLLLTIDSFIRNGKACYTSNRFLADRLQVGPQRVRGMLQHLEELGVITRSGEEEKRRLYITYPMYDEEEYPPAQKCIPPRSKLSGPPAQKRPHTITPYTNKLSHARTAGRGTATQGALEGGGRGPEHKCWKKFATMLANSIQAVRKINCTSNIGGWAKWFYKLYKTKGVSPSRIMAALVWYKGELKHLHKHSLIIFSGDSFYEKFPKMEAAMERQKLEQQEEQDPQDPSAVSSVEFVETEDDGEEMGL